MRLPDIDHPDGAFAFLVGTVLSQNISGAQAWDGARRLAAAGFGSALDTCHAGSDAIAITIRKSPAIHPFAAPMANAIWAAATTVLAAYQGDARRVWLTASTREELHSRLVSFRQIGPHKAAVAIHLLAEIYSVVPRHYRTPHMESLCPSVIQALCAETWSIWRRTDGRTTGTDI